MAAKTRSVVLSFFHAVPYMIGLRRRGVIFEERSMSVSIKFDERRREELRVKGVVGVEEGWRKKEAMRGSRMNINAANMSQRTIHMHFLRLDWLLNTTSLKTKEDRKVYSLKSERIEGQKGREGDKKGKKEIDEKNATTDHSDHRPLWPPTTS